MDGWMDWWMCVRYLHASFLSQFEELKRYQRSKYFFPPEDKTREFCRNLWCMQEQE